MSAPSAGPRTALAPRVAAEGNAIVTFEQMERMAASMAKSGLFGFKQPEQLFSLMLLAQAEGKHPALVARDYDFIQGRPSKKSEAMLRDFQASGGKVEWHELSDKKADATFSHPVGGTVRIDWDMQRAEQAGLSGKDGGMYKKYPRAMLRSRCISEGVRAVYPSATSGMYTPEEGLDIPEVRDVTPQTTSQAVEGAVEGANALTEAEREEHLMRAIKEADGLEALQRVFGSAWKHASDAKDAKARDAFKVAYDERKTQLVKPVQENSK